MVSACTVRRENQRSAGVGLAQGGYTFYYTIGKPYMGYKEYAHSVSLSLLMKM